MALKVYGSNVCPGTLAALNILTSNHVMPVFVNVTGSIMLLKEFIHTRDTNPIFSDVRGTTSIGFPMFELEDGTLTLDAKAAFASVGIDADLEF